MNRLIAWNIFRPFGDRAMPDALASLDPFAILDTMERNLRSSFRNL